MPLPPSITGQPPMGYSPASQPSGNPGQVASALAVIRQAADLLQNVLPKLPIGSEPHKAVMDAISKLAKLVPAGDQQPGVQKTAMQGMMQQMQAQQPMQNVMKAMGAQQPQQQMAA